ncbi:MAG: Uma2 family endonuclease [Pyrinomonadaceae bacterium]
MGLPQTLPTFNADEYLTLERSSEVRHEYLEGSVYAMAGESLAHSTICFNLAVSIGLQLRDTVCRGFSPNMKVRTNESGLFAYPDLAVVCGEPMFHDDHRDVLVNPTVIFEVLSPSTEKYDREEKYERYKIHITTLQSYVLIAQDRPHIEHYFRDADDIWKRTEANGVEAVLQIPPIDCQIPLAEIYARITPQGGV